MLAVVEHANPGEKTEKTKPPFPSVQAPAKPVAAVVRAPALKTEAMVKVRDGCIVLRRTRGVEGEQCAVFPARQFTKKTRWTLKKRKRKGKTPVP